jgi:hypothetical protein
MRRLFLETYPQDSKDNEAVPGDFPEDSKDDETVPGDLP